MASDSCVSGSEDARTPTHGKGTDGALNSPGAVQQPDSRPAPTAPERGGTTQQPTAVNGGGGGDVSPTRPDSEQPATRPAAAAGQVAATKATTTSQPAATTKPAATAKPAPTTKPTATAKPATSAKPGVVLQPAADVANGGAAAQSSGGATPSDEPDSAAAEPEPSRLLAAFMANHFLLFNAVPSWLVSMVVHAVLLIVLALITLPERPPEKRIVAVANPDNVEDVENLESEEIDSLDVHVFEGPAPAESIEKDMTTAEPDLPSLDDMGAAPDQFKLEDFGEMLAPSDDLLERRRRWHGERSG